MPGDPQHLSRDTSMPAAISCARLGNVSGSAETGAWIGVASSILCLLGCTNSDPGDGGPTMQIVGDSYKHRRGDPLPSRSAVFDGEDVVLRGVRGETLGLQVLLKGGASTAEKVALSLPVPEVSVQGFEMKWIEVRHKSTWLYGRSRGSGWYPDRLVPTSQPITTDAGAFFDIAISTAAAPGTYTGEFAVGRRVIPVELTIEAARIDIRAAPLVWVWYEPSELAIAHTLEPGGRRALDLERGYSELFRAHGGFSLGAHTPDDIRPREAFFAGVRYVPVLVDRSGDKARFQAGIRAWIDYFKDRPETPFAIPIDEPRSKKLQLRVKKWSRWAREAGSGADRFLFAVTDEPRKLYGDQVDVYVSWKGIPRRDPHLKAHLWTYNGVPGHAGSMIIDTDGAALRTWGWIAFRYRVPFWYAWAGMYYRDVFNDRGPIEVETDPVTFRDDSDLGNGDGLLAYPNALPSLRLKALRRGLQDRLLLLELVECGGEARARAIARRMIPRALGEAKHGAAPRWPTDEIPWEVARNQILDAIATTCTSTANN